MGAKTVGTGEDRRYRPGLLKWVALSAPVQWPHNLPTVRELKESPASRPQVFAEDHAGFLRGDGALSSGYGKPDAAPHLRGDEAAGLDALGVSAYGSSSAAVRAVKEGRVAIRVGEAIVLRTWPFHEADLLVSLFTREFGRVKGVARHAMRSRRRFGGALEPMTHVKATWAERPKQELVRLDAFEIVTSPMTGRVDLARLAGLGARRGGAG